MKRAVAVHQTFVNGSKSHVALVKLGHPDMLQQTRALCPHDAGCAVVEGSTDALASCDAWDVAA